MQPRLIRLRFRRRLRKGQRQVEELGVQAEHQLEEHLVKRFGRLKPVRRFVAGWLALLVLLLGGVVTQGLMLSGYFQTLQPVPGGIYNEGVRGRFTNANPLYATGDADATVSKLIFASLFTYDASGQFVGDLASGMSVDSHGTTYTVRLRPHLTWQDGKPLTSADVVYTYQTAQNPDAQSPLQSSWQGIAVSAPDPQTVVFRLPGVLASFPYNLTTGIIPRHILGKLNPADLRSSDFNTMHPVGAGPFAWQAIEVGGDGKPQNAKVQIALTPFAGYHAGKPKLQEFVVQVFADQSQLIDAFRDNRLTAVEGVSQLPADLRKKASVAQHSFVLRAATMVFFKTSEGVLADQAVRQALVQAADVPDIIGRLDYQARQVREPFLAGQLGYDPSFAQAPFDLKAAKAALTAANWKEGKDGIRFKDGKPLTFTLTASNNPDYRIAGRQLERQWKAAGVKVNVLYLEAADYQNALTYHSYDAILNGISIGSDPDVFVYWDSSQADIRSPNRLNLSEYKNQTADSALEAGRTRLDASLRVIKYKPFLQQWQHDSPALGLYQPRLLYATNTFVSGLGDQQLTTATDRFANVQNWQIRQARVTN
jgi:peptide/nickel transport system substrate-binding protein